MSKPMRKETSLSSIQYATANAVRRSGDIANQVDDFENDNRKQRRLGSQECRKCFYLDRPRFHLNGKPHRLECGICGVIHPVDDEATVRQTTVCSGCAKEHRLCKRCGGTIDMRDRRKFEVKSDE